MATSSVVRWCASSARREAALWSPPCIQLTRLVPAAVASTYADSEVTDDIGQRCALPVVAFWEVDPECLIETDEDAEMVERIDVQRRGCA